MQRMATIIIMDIYATIIIYLIIMAALTNIVSYNSTGLGSTNRVLLRDLLEETDATVCLLQETWLFKRDLNILNSLHGDYLGDGKSAIPETDILVGRPYGGVGIVWKKSIAPFVKTVEINCDRVYGIIITLAESRFLILNVYMPGDTRQRENVSEEYETCFDEIEKCIHEQTFDYLIIGGDFNTDLARATAQTAYFKAFLERNELITGWNLECAVKTDGFTHVTFTTPTGFSSCIDHFVFSCNMQEYVNSVYSIDYASYVKDIGHYPIATELSGLCQFSNPVNNSKDNSKLNTNNIAWHKVTDYEEYSNLVNTILSASEGIDVFPGLLCSNRTCRDPDHLCDINFVCKTMTDMCVSAAQLTLPKFRKHRTIPDWDTKIAPLKATSTLWGNIWNDNGRPTSGTIYDIYRKCRHDYHYAIRETLRNENDIRRKRMAEAIATDNSRNLWSEVKKIKGGATSRAPHIDGNRSDSDINMVFMEKYKSLYNSVPSELSDIDLHVNDNIYTDSEADFTIDTVILKKAIDKLNLDKSDGDKGLWSNLVINAPDSWVSLLAKLISAMISHGHTADEILLSTISSLPKSTRANICDSNNYRGIALTSSINKVIDWIVLIRYEGELQTSELQFAYKPGHSTSMCSLALKEVVKYYNSKNGQVYCCLIDATKAFDRVKFDKLFRLLIKRKMPMCIIRLLIDMYRRQKVRTAWGGHLSESFNVVNGVRQGGVLSPVLFAVYIDVLLNRLEEAGFGCYVGHEFMGALGSADDVSLLAPTLYALQKMIDICELYGIEYDVLYNAKKTVCMFFNGKRN